MTNLKLSSIYIGILFSVFSLNACKSNSSKESEAKDNTIKTEVLAEPIQKLSEQEIKTYHQRLSNLFDSHLLKSNFNGAILVAKGGNILYEKYVGYKDPQHKTDSIDENTAFHLASTSKPFTGMATLLLVQEGKLLLTDSLQKFFPNFPYKNITVQELLSHRSGLPSYLNFMEDPTKWPKGQMMSNQDVLNFMEKNIPAIYAMPDRRFHYNNTNYMLLALIIEKLSGKSYPQFMKQHIFDRIGMKHTFVFDAKDSTQHPIMSYQPNGAVWINDMFDDTYGDKNVYSTAKDMMLWDRALYNNNFIRQSLLDSAYTPHSHEKPSIHNYGLGWRLLNFKNGKNVVYHFGRWHGFTPAFGRLIDEQVAVIILGNKFNSNIYRVAKEVYPIFGAYGDKSSEDSSSIEENASETVTEKPVVVAPLPVKSKAKISTAVVAKTVSKSTIKANPKPISKKENKKIVQKEQKSKIKETKNSNSTLVSNKNTKVQAKTTKKETPKADKTKKTKR